MLKQFRGHTGAITTMATDSTGRVLFTAGADSTIRSWNLQSGQCLKVCILVLAMFMNFKSDTCRLLKPPSQTFHGHTRMILDIIVRPKAFYTSSTDLTVRSWVCAA
jgi:WD40 repeat protein